jgi:hypothetical protein
MVEDPDQAEKMTDAAAIAADLTRTHGAKALGRAQMQLYAAVNQREAGQVSLLSRVCMILMQQSREPGSR